MTWRDDDTLLLHGARTPIGAFLGAMSALSPTQMAAHAATAALQRADLDPAHLDATIVGNVLQSDPDAVYLARHVGLQVGAPVSAPALVVNRLCASGMEAIAQGARLLRAGEARAVLVGGAESMSRVPHALRGVRQGWGLGQGQVEDLLWSALTDAHAGCQIGQTVERLARDLGITRQDADEAALWSQRRAADAQAAGRLAAEIAPVEIKHKKKALLIDRDEPIRADATAEGIARLPGLYGPDSINTAGNSSGLHDAAAMLVMCSGAFARAHGLRPLGRVRAWATVGVEPLQMGLGPVEATRQALARAQLSLSDIDLIELNDAFAAQLVAAERALGLDRDRVNPNGGCLALGHPMGATGARLALTALLELHRRDAALALATLCVGGGMGMALILERT
jgi:acetyl-CoA acetyltransferase family protein